MSERPIEPPINCDCDRWDEPTQSVVPEDRPHACSQQDSTQDQPDPPTGVHIIRHDGTTLPCELTYNGTNPDGAHEWTIAGAVLHTGDTIRIATLPARTAIAFHTDSNKHPRATWSAMDD
jgi:hypothetical protein